MHGIEASALCRRRGDDARHARQGEPWRAMPRYGAGTETVLAARSGNLDDADVDPICTSI